MHIPLDAPNPLDALTTLVDRTLTVAHIVNGPVFAVDPTANPLDAAAVLHARDYDVAAVRDEPIARFTTAADLAASPEERVEDVAKPIPAAFCVERTFPLSHLLERLQAVDFVFVLDGGRVQHIVTRADLQAPAIGVVVLSYLTLIESGLRRLVAPRVGDSLLDRLSEARQAKVLEVQAARRRSNLSNGIEECLYFSDWLGLAGAPETGVLTLLGVSKNEFKRRTGPFADVRNSLAHGGTMLDGEVAPRVALDRISRIREFAEMVWEHAITDSPQFNRFLKAVIRLPRNGAILAGEGAEGDLPGGAPAHVLTAWNPGGRQRTREENRRANRQLRSTLERRGIRAKMVIAESPEGVWREELYLVRGLSRPDAAQIADDYGQRYVYELDEDEFRVVSCPGGDAVWTTDRRPER